MTVEASRRGYAFATVRPRGERNFQTHTVSIVFVIEEGPRVYIERINVRGNTRTRDYVIRREFDIAEGDAYNRALIDRAERRLKNLDYFKTVKILTEPGSSRDRVDPRSSISKRNRPATSRCRAAIRPRTASLAEVSVSERNLLGRGLYAKASVTYGQRARGYRSRSSSPICSAIGSRSASTSSSASKCRRATCPTRPRRLGFGRGWASALREDSQLQLRYSLYRQEVKLPRHAEQL